MHDDVARRWAAADRYSAVTAHLGYMTAYDEGKVMALAALGTDRYFEEFDKVVGLTPDGKPACRIG